MYLSTLTSHATAAHVTQGETELVAAYRAGDKRAGDTLVRNNLWLVRKVARDYRLWGADIDDLVQQGSLGLLKAVERFDAGHEQHLHVYAAYWIRAEIREYVVRTYRIVRLGTTRSERKALRMFRVRAVADATELARESGMPLARCEQLWPLLSRRDTQLDDSPGSRAPLDRFTREQQDPERLAIEKQREGHMQMNVRAALATLSERERRIAEARMMSDDPKTLDALGTELGLSRERVRQLETVIKTKMRTHLHADLAA